MYCGARRLNPRTPRIATTALTTKPFKIIDYIMKRGIGSGVSRPEFPIHFRPTGQPLRSQRGQPITHPRDPIAMAREHLIR